MSCGACRKPGQSGAFQSLAPGEYPDALVKRGLAQEELKNWEGAAKDYTKAIDALRPKDGRPDKALRGGATIQEPRFPTDSWPS